MVEVGVGGGVVLEGVPSCAWTPLSEHAESTSAVNINATIEFRRRLKSENPVLSSKCPDCEVLIYSSSPGHVNQMTTNRDDYPSMTFFGVIAVQVRDEGARVTDRSAFSRADWRVRCR
jgi:hypothetical protein